MTILTAPPTAEPPNLAGTTPLYISMRSIISTGISLMSIKSELSFIGFPSMKSPMRLPSSPRTDMREVLPVPPVARTVIPAVFARMSCTLLTVPCIWFMLITDMGMACSRNLRASLLPITTTSSNDFASAFRRMMIFFPLSLPTVSLRVCVW